MLAQKWMIQRCNEEKKPVFITGQIFKSMMVDIKPTRLESEEISQVTLEGVDCFLLTNETSQGVNSIETVQ